MTTPDKHYRYSIRKFNVGIASVAIAAFMFLGNGAVSVSANDLASNEEVIPTSGPVSEEDLSSSTEIKETELVSSSTLPTETPEETPAQTEKVVTEETVPVAENADSLPTNESQQESLSTKESDDALAAAKKVLEEVISEAEVLSADALRKAAKSTADTSSLQSAANATKAAAETANQVFADEHASLEDINAQITAIRTAVGNLGPELTSFTGTEEVTVMLAATTSGAADANQSGIDAISANNGQYTVTSEHTNFKWTDILKNPIIALKMTDGTYKYKKFSGSVTMDTAKAAYVADEFVDAATYKTANGPLQATDKVYIIQESDFTTDPTSISIEESYDLTKFHHRKNLIFGGDNVWDGVTADDLADPDADADSSAFIALARPGSFVSEIEFKDASHPGGAPIYLPKENNTVLVADSIGEALGQTEQSYKNFGLFLSYIDGNDDKVNKPNTVMELPKGVEVVFADQNDQQTTFAAAMNEIMAALQPNEEGLIENQQEKLKFKFIVKKDGKIIQQDTDWREITLHVYGGSDAVKGLVKTTTTNTANNFEAGIVDNIDFSGLPEEMKKEAIEMEKTYRNVDGTLPEDGAMPQFSNPDGKRYDWVVKVGEESDGTHATSPVRYFPYDMDLFQGDGDDITEALQGYIPYITGYIDGNGEPAKIAPSEHDKKLVPYYTLGSVFTRTMFDRNFTPEQGGVNESYWNSLVEDAPIPQLDFEPEVNLDIVTLSDNPQPNPKGTVKIVYKALNADGTDVDSSVVLRADVTDTEDAAVGTPWNAKETGVDHDKDAATAPIDERPETFTTQATETNPSREYKLVSAKTTVQTPTDAAPVTVTDDAQLEGQVIEGTTTVTYYYALVQEQPATSREVKGDVVIKYEDTVGTEIKGQLKDTDQGVVATYTTPSRRYIKVDNQVTYLDSEPAETVELSNLAYNADQTREDGTVEKPATIESAGKTYRFIKVKDDSATVTGLVTEATKTVTYVYAPEQTRQVPTPSNGSVIVEYKLEGSETTENPEGTKLQADFKDTTDQLVSTSTVTETYYVDANGVEKVTNTSEPVVTLTNATYEVTKAEAPDVLTIGGKTYHKVRVNGTENGTLPAGETKVTYYYAEEQVEEGVIEEKGNVTVKYETESGATLKPAYKDSENVLVSSTPTTRRYYLKDGKKVYLDDQPVRGTTTKTDATYDTREDKSATGGVNEKPATLTDESGTTYHLIKTKDKTPENGILPAGDTVVTYVYAPEQTRQVPTPSNGSVIVEYKLEGSETPEKPEGTKLQADFNDTTDQLVSTSTVTETYYVDANGKEQVTNTSEPVVTLTNATYEVTKDEAPDVLTIGGKTYHKVRVNGTENGTLPAGETKVTYYYAEEQVEEDVIEEKGNVTVKYETEGGAPLKPAYKDSENVLVSSTPTTRRYYLKDGNKVYLDEQPVRGTTTKTDATYDTREDKSATGGVNEKPATLTDETGKKYHLIKTKDKTPENGTLPAGDTVVTYVYAPEQTREVPTEKTGSVIVEYKLEGSETPEKPEGTKLQADFNDTTDQLVSTSTVTETYYVDANGVEKVTNTSEPVVTNTNATYEVTKDEAPDVLTIGGKTYHKVRVNGTENGTLPAGETKVTYYYAEEQVEEGVIEEKGNVTIKYETEGGAPLKSDYKDSENVLVSSTPTTRRYYLKDGNKVYLDDQPVRGTTTKTDATYDTREDKSATGGVNEKPATLTDETGTTYHLIKTKDKTPENGTLPAGDTVVTYVYAPEQTREVSTEKTGSVIVEYKLEGSETPEKPEGEKLQADFNDTTDQLVSTSTVTETYYVDENGEEQVTNTSEPVVTNTNATYEVTKDEAPDVLTIGGKTYHKVRVTGTENGTLPAGETKVTYYYAEEQVEEGVIEEKGNVTIKYETEGGAPLKSDYKDSENVLVSSTPTTRRYYLKDGKKVYLDEQPVRGTTTKTDATYDTREDKSATGGVNEKPATLTDESGTTYHLIKTKDKTPENGTLPAGDTVVTYVYAPEQTEIIPTENKAKVTVNYYILGTSTPLQPSYEDTPATKISETVTTNTYYLDANNERVPVGAPKVVTNPVDPAVTYNTTETKNGKEERPTTLESGGKTYHLVEAATTFTDGTGIRGNLTKDTVVNYYYAEIKDEVTTEPTNGSVTIKYESTDGTPLRDDKEDTSSTVISTKTTTKKYYVYNGEKVYVGDPVESTETKDLSYDTTEADKDEKPETLQKDGKTYQRVAVKAGSADENGKVTGDHVVTYVYAEVPEEPKPEEPKPEEPKPEEPKPEEPKPGEPTPPTDGGVNPPTDGGTTPPTDGGTTPPTDGGV
ncbi:TPA: MucBP domain-containing protein, partial [Streptococcus suis]|nr:MucBP domain-containing protein [Streptococcus suis]